MDEVVRTRTASATSMATAEKLLNKHTLDEIANDETLGQIKDRLDMAKKKLGGKKPASYRVMC